MAYAIPFGAMHIDVSYTYSRRRVPDLKGLGFSRAVNDPRNRHPDRSRSDGDGAVVAHQETMPRTEGHIREVFFRTGRVV